MNNGAATVLPAILSAAVMSVVPPVRSAAPIQIMIIAVPRMKLAAMAPAVTLPPSCAAMVRAVTLPPSTAATVRVAN
jgi:hypothetical protein